MLPRIRPIYVFICLLFLYGFYTANGLLRFERFLGSISISFDHFSEAYGAALKVAAEKDEALDFGHYDPPSTLDDNLKIPRLIHFIWFERLYDSHLDVSQIPVAGSDTPERCINANPDYTVKVWNATAARSLLEDFYPWFIPTYDGYRHPIQRVDAFKYFLLWHYGGIYIDLDISCRRSLDPLLEFPAWLPKAQPFGVNNDLMASRPHHPVIGKMIDMLKPRDRNLISPYLTIFWSTGPRFTSDILRMWFDTHTRKDRMEIIGREIPAPDDFFILPIDFYSEKYTFFGHRPGGTWHGSDVAFILWFAERPAVLISLATAFILIPLALWRRKALHRAHNTKEKLEEV